MTDKLFISSSENDKKLNRIETFPIELAISSSINNNQFNEQTDLNSNFLNSDENCTTCDFDANKKRKTSNSNFFNSQNDIVSNNLEKQSSGLDTRSQMSLEVMATSSDGVISVASYSYLNPLNWIMSTSNSIEEIESILFKCVKVPIDRYFVKIRNNSLKIWTISANIESKKTPIVLVHGFCGGVGMWIHNIDALSESRPFYAFDLLGFGRSSRPPFSTDPIVAETQFIESIEDWRKELNINQFILLGHSFGGYLSASYTLKYPNRVKALILADPWGFPEIPASKPDTPMPLWIRMIAKASQFVSPLSIFRVTGHVGVRIFKHLRPDFRRKYMTILDDPDAIYTYLYHANNFNPSGEAGFRAIAEYFGFAKNPMIRRIDKVNDNIPIWFIYGGRSWIDNSSGFASINLRQNSVITSVKLITGAGHHVYADKPTEFNEYVQYVFELIEEHDLRMSQENSNNNQASNYSSNSLLDYVQ